MHNTNIPCGCLIEYEGDQFHQDYSIDWCPLHKAASELLEALVKISDDPQYQMGRCVYCRYGDGDHADDCPVIEAHTAIAKATKE